MSRYPSSRSPPPDITPPWRKGGEGIYHNEMEYLLTSLLSTNIAQGAGLSIVLCYIINMTGQSRIINKEPVGQPYIQAARKLLPATKKNEVWLKSQHTVCMLSDTKCSKAMHRSRIGACYLPSPVTLNPPVYSLRSPRTEWSITVGSDSN